MPEDLAADLIRSWSLPGDLVLAPMGGAGITAKMALLADRRYLSMEVHEPYHRLAVRRLTAAHEEHRRRLDRFLVDYQLQSSDFEVTRTSPHFPNATPAGK